MRPPSTRPTVVLLHGLARTRHSLSGLRRTLERAGFETWARSYPSRRLSIADAAAKITDWIARDLPGDRPLAAVTHSLGGILVRHIEAHRAFTRIVMLAPPNQGSHMAHVLDDHPLYRWFFGPAGQELAAPDQVRAWPQPRAPCAVIAGIHTRAAWHPLNWLTGSRTRFPPGQPNDGIVTVAETRLPDMAAFATIEARHTFIMNNRRARELVLRFLQHGTF